MHEIIENYKIREHAILGPLHAQGPSGLIRISHPQPEREYGGPYHCCYLTRRELLVDTLNYWHSATFMVFET